MLWGPISDRYGRRLVYLVCLSILVASSIGLALCPTSHFWLLLFLLCWPVALAALILYPVV